MAHELRTPLHIIQGNLEGVLDGVYAPTPEHIEATLEETRQLARLVEDLRTLSLAESGELPLVREAVDVGDLLADVATSFSAQAEAAGVDLRVTTADAVPPVVMGDAGRLDQVLSNLVANAIRHTPRGGNISLAAANAGNRVRITVADTGEGIAAEDLPYIFDRFWRGDRARSHGGGAGSGLGLATRVGIGAKDQRSLDPPHHYVVKRVGRIQACVPRHEVPYPYRSVLSSCFRTNVPYLNFAGKEGAHNKAGPMFRPSTCSMAVTIISEPEALRRMMVAPASRPVMLTPGSSRTVSSMIGVPCSSSTSRSFRQISNPLSPRNRTSNKITSGRSRLAISMPRRPSSAVSVR